MIDITVQNKDFELSWIPCIFEKTLTHVGFSVLKPT